MVITTPITNDTERLNAIKEETKLFLKQLEENVGWLTAFEFVDTYSTLVTDQIVSQLKNTVNAVNNFASTLERMKKDEYDNETIVMERIQ